MDIKSIEAEQTLAFVNTRLLGQYFYALFL